MKTFGIAIMAILLVLCPVSAALAMDVWEIEFRGEVTPSQVSWMEDAYAEALEQDVQAILVTLDTPGGRIDSALEIGQLFSTIPTIVLVDGGAISAGSFMALSADQFFMLEGTTIGAAEPRLGTEKADEKTVSFWSAQLAAMAERNDRDPLLARAMADEDMEIEGVVEKGKLLTLTAQEALSLDMTDGVYSSMELFLVDQDIQIVNTVTKGTADFFADFLTSSIVSSALLMIGLAGILIEIFTPGFGLPGAVGLGSLALYFGGSMMAGLSGWEAVLLFLLGLILIIVEVFFIPGFGVAGIGGFVAIFASIFVAAPDASTAVQSIVLALTGSIIIVVLLVRVLPTRKAFSKLMLKKETSTESGYIAIPDHLGDLKGKTGVAVSHMRPAGTVRIDGTLVDALTRGNYIKEYTPIVVREVIGGRIFVEEIKKEDE